jgi:predicted N-acetyltransferase YhbS
MFDTKYSTINEEPIHATSIEQLNAEAFGPGRHARAAARIREQGPHQLNHSYVCVCPEQGADDVVGSVRMTPIYIGEDVGYLLGPLAVRSQFKKQGLGRKLVAQAIQSVKSTNAKGVILVGDLAYYGPMGFEIVQSGNVKLPGPADAQRTLVHHMTDHQAPAYQGLIRYRQI